MTSGTISENIGKLSNGTVLFVEWHIQNFLSLPHDANDRIHSPTFQFGGVQWYFRMYPNGQTEKESVGYINFFILKQNSPSLVHRVKFHLGLNKHDGTVYKSWQDERDFEGLEQGWGAFRLVKRSVVCDKDNGLALNDEVTFFCYLQMKSEGTSDASTQTTTSEDYSEWNGTMYESPNDNNKTSAHKLAKNLKDLLLSKEECDITLKVKDQEFQAHRAILIARSSVFSSMLRHEMAEKLSGEVNIPDCDPGAFQLFLLYIYTGTAEGISSNNVFNLYAIAHKYDAIELQMNCTEYMKDNLSVENVCDVIKLSLLHDESDLLDMATYFFAKHFKDIIVTIKWRCFLEENTMAGNELLIKASKYYVPPT